MSVFVFQIWRASDRRLQVFKISPGLYPMLPFDYDAYTCGSLHEIACAMSAIASSRGERCEVYVFTLQARHIASIVQREVVSALAVGPCAYCEPGCEPVILVASSAGIRT